MIDKTDDIENSDIEYSAKKIDESDEFHDDILNDLDSSHSNSQNITQSTSTKKRPATTSTNTAASSMPQQIIIIDSNVPSSSNTNTNNSYHSSSSAKQTLLNTGLSPHIVQNYTILAQEITAPLTSKPILITNSNSNANTNESNSSSNNSLNNSWSNGQVDIITNGDKNLTILNDNLSETASSTATSAKTTNNATSARAQKDLATCQFCGRAMLKKNIPTHIRRAHTPKEELVCLNEEQNIFTLHHLKPGQRRKRSARAYDYSLMTATVSIDEDPCEGIENKFITEGEEILSSDLLQLADRIKYGISQIPNATLTKLIDILGKIESSTQDEVSSNAKAIRNMIFIYLTSGEEFKYKLRQVGDDIIEKKKQVNSLRADLKEVMSRKAQLERKIQPLVCELQKLEDQHGTLIESINQLNDHYQFEYLNDLND